jgi:hypothetical protein
MGKMGRFADLADNATERLNFWAQFQQLAWQLLNEINEDLLGQLGHIETDFLPGGDNLQPFLTKPNYCLLYEVNDHFPCMISICVTPKGDRLRVRARFRETLVRAQDVQIRSEQTAELELALRNMLIWLLDQGLTQ